MARILSLMPYHVFPPQTGGQRAIFSFVSALARKHELVAVSTNLNAEPEKAPFELLNFFGPTRWRYLNINDVIRVHKLCKERKIQYIITDHPYYAWQAWVLKKWLGVPCYVRSHNIEYMRFRSIGKPVWRILFAYEKWAYSFADAVFYITDEDAAFARETFHLEPSKCHTLPYGIPYRDQPLAFPEERQIVNGLHKIPSNAKILLFNGALDHTPNQEAVIEILHGLNPLLKEKLQEYRIIICGRRMPSFISDISAEKWENVIYAGFVEDIDLYIKSADVMINPILSGGGVKTKVIEALGYNRPVVSYETGAIGIRRDVCGSMLQSVADSDYKAFVNEVVALLNQPNPGVPAAFYNYYHLDSIVENLKEYFSH